MNPPFTNPAHHITAKAMRVRPDVTTFGYLRGNVIEIYLSIVNTMIFTTDKAKLTPVIVKLI
jgi:hypothetical protein